MINFNVFLLNRCNTAYKIMEIEWLFNLCGTLCKDMSWLIRQRKLLRKGGREAQAEGELGLICHCSIVWSVSSCWSDLHLLPGKVWSQSFVCKFASNWVQSDSEVGGESKPGESSFLGCRWVQEILSCKSPAENSAGTIGWFRHPFLDFLMATLLWMTQLVNVTASSISSLPINP